MTCRPGKRAAILCPGPGLAATLPRLAETLAEVDLVIAVNRAAIAWPADYWAILDPDSFRDVTPIGKPRIIMGGKSWTRLLRRSPEAEAYGVMLREDLSRSASRGPPRVTRWHSYTATVAVVGAWALEAREILVYGADLKGTADWDGTKLERQVRNERRWRREGETWILLTAWLHGEGVTVERCEGA